MKTGVENYIFWSEIGSGFEEPGGTPRQKFPGVPPTPGKNNKTHLHKKGWALALVLKMRVFGTWK